MKPAFLETAFIRLLSTFYFYHLVHFSLHSMHDFALSFYLFACFLFAFACNAKGFTIVTLVLFLLFLLFAVFGRLPEVSFKNFFSFVIQQACDQDRTYFIEHTQKKIPQKLFLKLFFETRVANGMSCALKKIIMV